MRPHCTPFLLLALVGPVLVACSTPGHGAGSATDDASAPPDPCHNGQRDPGESDLDCGGACAACATGKACFAAADCASGVCGTYLCRDDSCGNGVRDSGETGLDCGGGCPACAGEGCSANADCSSGYCHGNVCDVPTCSDAVKNGTETGVDCGGDCDQCGPGGACLIDANCTTGYCASGFCGVASCSDGAKNAAESDVDCGGACTSCGNGKACHGDADCTSGKCGAGVCQAVAASCEDGTTNGSETDRDCGGSCPACGFGRACHAASDCASGTCDKGACAAAPSCSDNLKSGSESDLDCGGDCRGCALGLLCNDHADCLSQACIFGRCALPTCSDKALNQDETDIDCGGSACPACASGRACTAANGGKDCASGLCCGGVCVPGTGADHCGSCSACAGDPHGDPICEAKTCGLTCDSGYHACGTQCAPKNSVQTCGASCTPCKSDPHGTATCNGSTCGLACAAGYHLCGDRCVANTSVDSCGASCGACPTDAHGTATCDGEACGVTCKAGYHWCGNACVADNSVDHCGASCSPCAAPGSNASVACVAGACEYSCDAGSVSCGTECRTHAQLDESMVVTAYQTSYSNTPTALIPQIDGGFLIVGSARDEGAGDTDTKGWILRIDHALRTEWHLELPPLAGWRGLTVNDGYALPGGGWRLGGTLSNEPNDSQGWLAEVDGSGKLIAQVALPSAPGIVTLAPGPGSDSFAVGGLWGYLTWYGRLTATGLVSWEVAPPNDVGHTGILAWASATSGGNLALLRSTSGGAKVTVVAPDGTRVLDVSSPGIVPAALVGYGGGDLAVVGWTTTYTEYPAITRISGTGVVLGTTVDTSAGYWTVASGRPGEGLILGGVADTDYFDLTFGLSRKSGELEWTTRLWNVDGDYASHFLLIDTASIPTGGYAWLAKRNDASTGIADTAYLVSIQCTGQAPAPGPGPNPDPNAPVISEFLVDALGADHDVFVELHGVPGTSLEGYRLAGVNGNGGADYKVVDLTGFIGSDGLYVIGNTDAMSWIADVADQLADVDYQNGPDSLQLRDAAGNVVDAVGYGTFTASDVFAGEGRAVISPAAGQSLQRDGAEADSGDNAADFHANTTPTPGTR